MTNVTREITLANLYAMSRRSANPQCEIRHCSDTIRGEKKKVEHTCDGSGHVEFNN